MDRNRSRSRPRGKGSYADAGGKGGYADAGGKDKGKGKDGKGKDGKGKDDKGKGGAREEVRYQEVMRWAVAMRLYGSVATILLMTAAAGPADVLRTIEDELDNDYYFG